MIDNSRAPLPPSSPPPTSLSLPCRSSSLKTCDYDSSRAPLPPSSPPTSLPLPCRSSGVKTCDYDNSEPPLPPSFPLPRSHSPAVHQVLRRVIMITAELLYPFLPPTSLFFPCRSSSVKTCDYDNSRAPLPPSSPPTSLSLPCRSSSVKTCDYDSSRAPLPPSSPPTSLPLPCRSSGVKTCDYDNSGPPLPPSFPLPRSHSPAVHQVLRRVIMITAEPLYPLPSPYLSLLPLPFIKC